MEESTRTPEEIFDSMERNIEYMKLWVELDKYFRFEDEEDRIS